MRKTAEEDTIGSSEGGSQEPQVSARHRKLSADALKDEGSFSLETRLLVWTCSLYVSLFGLLISQTVFYVTIVAPSAEFSVLYLTLTTSEMASFAALPLAFMAETYSSRDVTMLLGSSLIIMPTAYLVAASLEYDDFSVKWLWFQSSIRFLAFYYVNLPLVDAFFTQALPRNSPLLRRYVFFMYFMEYVWELLYGLMAYLPSQFEELHSESYVWAFIGMGFAVWIQIMIIFSFLVYMRKAWKNLTHRGVGPLVMYCMYITAYELGKTICHWIRDHDTPLPDNPFELCATRFAPSVVQATKKLFVLFVINMCMMYFHGMENVLRHIWYSQDRLIVRADFFLGFSPDLLYTIAVLLSMLVVEFVALPIMKNYSKFRFSDLRAAGFAVILFGLSYCTTMMLQARLLQEQLSSPSKSKLIVRVYNCMIFPVAWNILSNNTSPIAIHIPPRASRVYINDIQANYSMIFNNTIFSFTLEKAFKLGDVDHYILRDNGYLPIRTLDALAINAPNSSHQAHDADLVLINCFFNESSFLNNHLVVKIRHRRVATIEYPLKRDFTALRIKRGRSVVSVRDPTRNMTSSTVVSLNRYGLESILVSDTEEQLRLHTDHIRIGLIHDSSITVPQILLAAVAVAMGKVAIHLYIYKNAPEGLLATSYAVGRTASAWAHVTILTFTNQFGFTLETIFITCFFVFLFSILFFYVIVSDYLAYGSDEPQGAAFAPPVQEETATTILRSGSKASNLAVEKD